MKHNCIEMNNNKNCLFGDTTGHKECLNITEPKLPEDKPCLDCEIYYSWWDIGVIFHNFLT